MHKILPNFQSLSHLGNIGMAQLSEMHSSTIGTIKHFQENSTYFRLLALVVTFCLLEMLLFSQARYSNYVCI